MKIEVELGVYKYVDVRVRLVILTPPVLIMELMPPVKVPITHSIQNKTWRDVHDVLLSTITLKL